MPPPVLALVATHTATTYSFVGSDGHLGWANCTVDDDTGQLSIASDWGDWQHRWSPDPRNLGAPTLTAFIGTRGDVDYLARKLQHEGREGRMFSGEKTSVALRRRLCERRLAGGRCRDPFQRLERDEARRLWKAIGELGRDVERNADLFYERALRIEGFADYITEEPWEYGETEQTPQDKALREVVLPALIKACRETSPRSPLTKERVREVVREAVDEAWPKSWPRNEHTDLQRRITADAIAARAAKELAEAVVEIMPPRKEWDAAASDRGDYDGHESSDYVDGWNDALDAVEGAR